MTLLSKKLDEIRARFTDQHGAEQAQIIELDARLRQQDERVLAGLDDLLAGLEQRRALVHARVVTLSRCVGLLPPPRDAAALTPAETLALDVADDPAPLTMSLPPIPLPNVFERERERQAAERVLKAVPPSNGHYGSFEGASDAHGSQALAASAPVAKLRGAS